MPQIPDPAPQPRIPPRRGAHVGGLVPHESRVSLTEGGGGEDEGGLAAGDHDDVVIVGGVGGGGADLGGVAWNGI